MKKLTIFPLFCLSLFFTKAQVIEKVVLNESFSNNDSYWNLFEDADGSVSMLNGKLFIENKTKTTLTPGIGTYFDTLTDFSITVTASIISTKIATNVFGFYFGDAEHINEYYFLAATTDKGGGAWAFGKLENKQLSYLSKWAATTTVKPGLLANNTLSIKQEKDNWIFFINDKEVGKIKAQHFSGDQAGFYVEDMQRVAFSNLVMKNYYPQVSASGKLCEMLPLINEQAKSEFNHINTWGILRDPYERRTRVKSTDDKPKYVTSLAVTDAEQNFIGTGKSDYEYTARLATCSKPEDAIKKSDSISKQLTACLKNFLITKLPEKQGTLPVYKVIEKTPGGYKRSDNVIRITKDSTAKQTRYFVEAVISSYQRETYFYITNKSDNSKLAAQLKELRVHSKNNFKDITGEFIPGSDAKTSSSKEYNTNYKLESAKRNYIKNIGGNYFHAVLGENMTEKEGTALFNSMFEKLKKALGNGMVYTIGDWGTGWAEYKSIHFKNKEDDSKYVFDLTITRPDGKYKVELAAY